MAKILRYLKNVMNTGNLIYTFILIKYVNEISEPVLSLNFYLQLVLILILLLAVSC
jgi:hypothetical protein